MPTLEKHTSKSNPNLIGHEMAETEFLNSYNNKNLHHSWIVTGEHGIGKATLCYRIARYIFANSSKNNIANLGIDVDISSPIITNSIVDYDDEGDGETLLGDFVSPIENKNNSILFPKTPLYIAPSNSIFDRFLSGGLTDLIIIEREWSDKDKTKLKTEITVEQIRNLKLFLSKTSAEDGYKIAIIDSVDDMNTNSKNALLKVLEEAPKKTLLLLVCNNYNGLLETIKSRCRTLKLNPLDDESIELLIKHNINNISDDDCKKLTHLSMGSIGDAIMIYENHGLLCFDTLIKLFNNIFGTINPAILEITKLISNDEQRFNIFKHLIFYLIDNVIRYKTNTTTKFLSNDEEAAIKKFALAINDIECMFKLREKMFEYFISLDTLNLDMTGVIFTIIERLKNVY